MIKKILLTLLLFGFRLFNFSFAGSCDAVTSTTKGYGIYLDGTGVSKIGSTYQSYIDSQYRVGILNNGTLFTQSLGYGKSVFSPNYYQVFFWNKNGDPYIYWNDGYQGVPYHYFICDEFTGGTQLAVNCSHNYYSEDVRPIISNFLSKINSSDYFGYYVLSSTYDMRFYLCLSSSEIGNSICFTFKHNWYNSSSSRQDCELVNSLGYTGLNFNKLGLDIYGESPGLNGGGDSGDFPDSIPENGFPNTNRGVFEAYAEEGYVLSRCYSDFSLDNLSTSTGGIYQFYETDLDDGVYYTGATIIDLYDTYSYGNPFNSFFNFWYNNYQESLLTESPAKFVGLSKGLWGIANKYYYAGLSDREIDFDKFYNYCSYFVDFSGDWDGEYIGPQLPSNVSDNLAISSSAINYLSGFIHNQLTGSTQNFDPDSFFQSLTVRFDRLLNRIDGSFEGLIPGYILMVMMALIFIRIISH